MSYKRKRITVKIGSNVLARPDGTLDITRMSALTDQIASYTKPESKLLSYRRELWHRAAAN